MLDVGFEGSEEVEEVLQCAGGGLSEGDSSEGSQFVGVLTWGRDSHGSRPVEVHVAHLVRDPLELVRVQPLVVSEDVVGARAHGPLTSGSGHEEEVVSGSSQEVNSISI